ncbi:hypothetical protein SLE2022_390980 [Rubroshorea leprosula]
MVRHGEKKAFCRKWPTDIAPRAYKKLQKNVYIVAYCHPQWNGETSFKVKNDNEAFAVEFTDSTCTCQSWQLTGIPWPHACACLIDQNQNVEEYVSHYYKKDTYLEVYKEPIYPSRGGMRIWNQTGCEPMNPPPFRKQAGRPKKKIEEKIRMNQRRLTSLDWLSKGFPDQVLR